DHRAGARLELAAELHALARRPGDLELRIRSGSEHSADGDLLQGEARCEPGRQRTRQLDHLPGRGVRTVRRIPDAPRRTPASAGCADGRALSPAQTAFT